MVAREFLEELSSIRHNFDWKYDGPSRNIRAKLKSRPNEFLFDPIGAVCYSKTGLSFDEENWFEASKELGLSHIDAGDLTAAANNIGRLSELHHAQNLRRDMINCLRMQPETDVMPGSKIQNSIIGPISNLLKKVAPRLDDTNFYRLRNP